MEVGFVKSAQAHRSFPASGSNDRLLSGMSLPGPHTLADQVFADPLSHVQLPRNSLSSPTLAAFA